MSDSEQELLADLSIRLRGVRALLQLSEMDDSLFDRATAFRILSNLKTLQGNLGNSLSSLACLAAKDYLRVRFGLLDWDCLAKAQGAPGTDVEVELPSGQRLIGEIKTTTPCRDGYFGAQQKSSIQKDLKSLANARADFKILFLTDPAAFKLVRGWPSTECKDVEIVLLRFGELECDAEGETINSTRAREPSDCQIEFVEEGKLSSTDLRIKLICELGAALELCGCEGLSATHGRPVVPNSAKSPMHVGIVRNASGVGDSVAAHPQ